MQSQVRVAVVQAAPVLFNKAATVDKAVALTREAATKGAKIVLFPEAFVPCYPRGMSFGAKVGRRLEEGRKDFRRYYENSMTDNGPEAERLAAVAAETGVYLCMGVTEQAGSSLFCSQFFWGPDGKYLGKHRKLKPTGSERLIWSEGDGSTMPAIPTPYGTMGTLICWENYMPLARAAMYAKGVDLYLAPTADSRDHWQCTIQHIALEGRCFVLSCNQYVTKDMVPANLATYADLAAEPDLMCRGGSAIISPLGEYLAGPLWNAEGILTADLDLGRIVEARYDFDSVGHYARNDVFTLVVDECPQRGAEFLDEPEDEGGCCC